VKKKVFIHLKNIKGKNIVIIIALKKIIQLTTYSGYIAKFAITSTADS